MGFPFRVDNLFIEHLTRLINLIADDNAIEDTIYHLHRALHVGRMDLERFLRASLQFYLVIELFLKLFSGPQSTRILAEEQFMKRALIEKILTSVPSSSVAPDWV